MAAMPRPKESEAAVRLDKGLYRKEAAVLAAAAFSGRAEFFIEREDENSLEVVLQLPKGSSPEELAALAGEYLNEALNQELRLDLAQQNARLIELLTAQVLASAGGQGGPRE